MPIFTLRTNVSSAKIPADFVKNTVDIVAKTLGKPKSYVVVNVLADQNLNWGGVDGPAGIASLESIGQLGREPNKKHSKTLFAHIEKELGIPSDRLYINYTDLNKANVGYSGTTFDDLL